MRYQFDFGYWHYFFLLAFLVSTGLWYFRLYRINQYAKIRLIPVGIKTGLRLIYLILFLIASLSPYTSDKNEELSFKNQQNVKSHDVYFALDLSLSMLANDVSPDRLTRVKHELKRLADRLKNDKIGLIIFSSSAFINSPLSFDRNMTKMMIDDAKVGVVSNTGTDLSSPLKLALQKFKDNSKSDYSKVIVLVSDGEDFSDDINSTIEELSNLDATIFTLGVGTGSGGKIHLGDGFYKKDKNGSTVVTKLNNGPLKKIAAKGNGQYFELNNTTNQINQLVTAITNLQTGNRKMKGKSANKNLLYYYFLLPGFILLSLDIFIKFNTTNLE